MRKRCFSSGLAGVLLLACVLPAAADDLYNFNSFRSGAFVGLFVPNSASWTGDATLPGLPPIAASGRLTLNPGTAAGGFADYAFDDFLGIDWLKRKVNIQGQIGYVTQTFNRLDGTVTITGLGSYTGPVPIQGHTNTLVGAGNILLTPFGQRGLGFDGYPLTPYIGVGSGIARTDVTLNSFTVGPNTIAANATSSEIDPVFNFTVGVDITPLPQSMPRLEIGLAYQYSRIFSDHLGSGSGIVANSGNVSGHIFGLVAEYRITEND